MGIKVVRLPKSLDVNKMTEDIVREQNSTCPFCKETRKWANDFYRSKNAENVGVEECTFGTPWSSWYGKRDEYENDWAFLRFWEPDHHWKRLQFECHTCGAKWMSDAFPTDIVKFK